MFLAARWNSILIILCVLASCTPAIKSEPDALRDLTLPTEPQKGLFAKVRQQYPSDRYLIGIGQADSEKAATELARADLMKQIRVEVRVTWTDLIRERGANTEQEVSRLVETEVAELVKGVEIVDQGTDTKTGAAYAVAVLPKAEMERILQKPRGLYETTFPPPESEEPREGIWVTAEGIVSLGDDTTVAEAKARSRDEARRKAIEQAVGTFVKGQRVVYNAQLAEDLVRSLVRGIVVEEQVLEEGVRQLRQDSGAPALQYATKLKAKVKPVHVEHKGEFTLKSALNKTVFQEKEEMQITVVPSKDAYIHIFNVGQDDTVTVLFPNRFVLNNFIDAQKELVFPDEAQRTIGILLRVFPPAGANKALEKIKLIATTRKIDLLKGKIREGVYQVYPGKDSALVIDLLKELSVLDESEWAETTVPYEVRK